MTQRQENDRKRAVALKFTAAPQHQGNKYGNLNDSHLCCYSRISSGAEFLKHDNDSRVLICTKYVDAGKSPGIGVYFEPSIKAKYLPSLSSLTLPEGFELDVTQSCMRSRVRGWVVFCKNDCKKFDTMYKQIVCPGTSFEAWRLLYEVLKKWLKDTFHAVYFFDEECLDELNPSSFTEYP